MQSLDCFVEKLSKKNFCVCRLEPSPFGKGRVKNPRFSNIWLIDIRL